MQTPPYFLSGSNSSNMCYCTDANISETPLKLLFSAKDKRKKRVSLSLAYREVGSAISILCQFLKFLLLLRMIGLVLLDCFNFVPIRWFVHVFLQLHGSEVMLFELFKMPSRPCLILQNYINFRESNVHLMAFLESPSNIGLKYWKKKRGNFKNSKFVFEINHITHWNSNKWKPVWVCAL